ncbi:M56/M15 family metallopeptidase [Olleya sp. 1-3]|uniref:M56/M15 family metallopeptidase n=1 Tax=Olleya sp. 1-3 TaxID=2058323 RepID=UPI0018E30FBB|nr:M56/M15 family metallopeptidase [Olleya sp. 1-3]
MVAPFLEIKFLNSIPSITEIPVDNFKNPVIIDQNIEGLVFTETEIVSSSQNSPLFYIYLVITLFFIFRFLNNILKVYNLTRTNYERLGSLKLIKSNDSDLVSSFFNYMFINENHTLTNTEYLSVLKHETIHSKQLHSIDIILSELFICTFWFNPFIWLYKKAILQNHEFIADEVSVLSGIDIENYSNTIINLGKQDYRIPLTSGFNFIQIKNRIIMLHQTKSSVLNQALKISVVLILFAGIFVFSSYKDLKEPLVVVIDAGHGGKDPGNMTDVKEKEIILEISNLLATYSNEKIKIIQTRSADKFLSLQERADIVNNANADFMISLHCNSHKDELVSGVEAYYLDKNETKETSQKYSNILIENKLNVFSKSHGIKVANLYLLKNVKCPATYLELGFLSNKTDKAILTNKSKREVIAKSIFESLNKIRSSK